MTRPSRLEDVRVYPLTWPAERKRTLTGHHDGRKRWDATFTSAMADLQTELQAADIFHWILSSNLQPHTRGWDSVADPGAAVWFNQQVRGHWVLSVLACDTYRTLIMNVKAIAMTLNRLRLIDDYGVYTVDQAIQGAAYLALPGPETPAARPWQQVMAIDGEPPKSSVEMVYYYRFLAGKLQADPDKLKELNVARDEARKHFGVPTE